MNQALQPFPISQLGAMADKQQIGCVEGIVKGIWKAKASAPGAEKPWSFQNVTLTTDTGEVKLKLKDREELALNLKGRRIRVESLQSDKGLSGLYVMDDEYQGKTERLLKVTPSASISLVEGSGGYTQQQPAQQQQPQQQRPQTQQRTAAQQAAEDSWGPEPEPQQQPQGGGTTQQKKAQPSPLADAKLTVTQIINLHLICSQAVTQYEVPQYKERTKREMTEGQVQGAIASVFIEACRSGLVHSMPRTSLERQEKMEEGQQQ